MSAARGEARGLSAGHRLLETAGLALVAFIFLLSARSWGLAEHGWERALAFTVCGLLGLWAVWAGWKGRWSARDLRPAAAFLLIGAGVLLTWTFQLIPLPAGWVSAVSPAHQEALTARQASGLDQPAMAPLALAPEAAWRGWHQTVAALLFFAGAALLARRRRGAWGLIIIVASASTVEGLAGLARMLSDAPFRSAGLLYNPNHHAAAVLMGLPVLLAASACGPALHPRLTAPLLSGRNPLLVLWLVAFMVLFGWASAASRASLLLGAPVLAVWGLVELLRYGNPSPARRWFIAAGSLLVLLAVTSLFLSTGQAWADRLFQEGGFGWAARWDAWRATWAGWLERPFLGLGPGGAEYVINRHAQLPVMRAPIHTHNDWLEFAASLGFLGLLLLLPGGLFFLQAVIRQERRRAGRLTWEDGLLRRAALAGLLSALAHAVADFHLRLPAVGFLALALLALALGRGTIRATAPSQ